MVQSCLHGPRDSNQQFTEFTLERFLAFTVAGIASTVGDRFMLIVTKMFSHFCLQRTFNECFSELLEKTILTN
jgi:hypothetical protein